MTFDEYQQEASLTAIYPGEMAIVYPLIGLCGETGEVAEKIKKVIRDHNGQFTQEVKAEIAKELGDVLWYLSAISSDMGYSLDDVAKMNIAKIRSRNERNSIHGNGDNR